MAQVGWEERRANMVEVCTVCHTGPYVANSYEPYDGVIELYNSKFANPGLAFMKLLKENGLITEVQFDEDVEWTWWEIWHDQSTPGTPAISVPKRGPSARQLRRNSRIATATTDRILEIRCITATGDLG